MAMISSLLGNSQKLDGGAMFGNVPKAIWSQWVKPDEQNRIHLACRAMLIQDDHKVVLLETGIGAFFNPLLRDRYGVQEDRHVLLESLKEIGLSENDIDMIVLSHLHFDHAGGLLSAWIDGKESELLFPKAKYLVSKPAWERAIHPHVRDRASFIPQLNALLEQSNRLIIVEHERSELLGKDYQFRLTNGHTPGLLHTIYQPTGGDDPIIFASDLIPGTHWVHLPVSMGYDRSPEMLIDEKREMLELAIKLKARLFYTHDPEVAMSRVALDKKGRYIVI